MTTTPPSTDLLDPQLPPYQARRRRQILDAAYELLKQNEFEQIQIRDVAAAAGVALGTLYRYFPSKEQLYSTVLFDWNEKFAVVESQWSDLDDLDRLARRIERAVKDFERRPQFFNLSMQLMHSGDLASRELGNARTSSLDVSILNDLQAFPPEERHDLMHIIWGTLMMLMLRVSSGASTMLDFRSTVDTLMTTIRMRHDQLTQGQS